MSAPISQNAKRPSSVDVAVIGAGPAGSALSALLAEAGLKVMMVDETGRPRREYGECLPAAAKPMLTSLKIWTPFLRDGHIPAFGTRSFWGSREAKKHDFRQEGVGCAWHLSRYAFDQRLMRRAVETGVRTCSPVRITGVDRKKDLTWRLSFSSPQDQWVSAVRFVVDATGAASRFASHLGVSRKVDDRLVALSCLLEGKPGVVDSDSFSTVEAGERGWWYTARIPGDRRIASFLTDPDLISKKITPGRFWSAMLKKTSWTASHLKALGYQIGSGPHLRHVGSSRLERFSGKGWLAVGNAAFSCDPLCSQGITAPLLSAFHAKDAITTLFRGNGEAADAYAGLMDLAYSDYLALRKTFYTRESRWPEAPFWRRRRQRECVQPVNSGLSQLVPYSLG